MFDRAARGWPALLLGLLTAAAPTPAVSEEAAVCAAPAEPQVLSLVNAERAALGRPALLLDVRLTAAARRHVEDLRAGCFPSYPGSDGSSASLRMAEAG